MTSIRTRVKGAVRRLGGLAFRPLLERIDAMSAETSTRLDHLTKRVEDIEILLRGLEGRTATAVERSTVLTESQQRLNRRLEEIEKLLSES